MNRTNARHTDPVTSHAAAQSVGNVTEAQRRIVDVLQSRVGGFTDEEIFSGYRRNWGMSSISPSGCRTRRKELVEQGRVRHNGVTRPLASGRDAMVWEAV